MTPLNPLKNFGGEETTKMIKEEESGRKKAIKKEELKRSGEINEEEAERIKN